MPIACRGKNYLNRCDTPALSRAGRKMFFEIGMRKEYIVSFGLSIEQDHLAAQEMSAEEEFALIEREPTAYAMRRNTATHLYNVGLDENQSSYIMGHKIYDEHIHQKEYSTPELLYEIKKRMALRPIINAISDSVEILQLERNRASSHSGTYEQIIHIPSHSSATIMAIPFIPEDDISITEISENESGIVHVQRSSYVTNTAGRSRHATMLRLYHKMYKDAVGNYVISL
jgi:hypothetical protein